MSSWYCPCGAQNDIGEKSCLFCGSSAECSVSAKEADRIRSEKNRKAAKLNTQARIVQAKKWVKTPRYILLSAAILIAIGVITYRQIQVSPFQKHIDEYISVPFRGAESSPYVRGKVVVVDLNQSNISSMFFDLPEELKPANPEEVGTVVLISCSQFIVGHYGDAKNWNREASQWHCDLKVIDRIEGALTARSSFDGSPPPEYVEGGGGASGSKPIQAMLAYIAGLPRR